MPHKNSIRFEDLGLTTPVPHALCATREQKRKERHDFKKEKNLRSKAAMEQLSISKAKVEEHKEFIKKEEAFRQEEKKARRKMLHELQEAARLDRQAKEVFKKEESLAFQREYISKLATNSAEIEKRAQEVREAIDHDTKRLISLVPKSVYIPVRRLPDVDASRKELPVLREEQAIVEAINNTFRTCVLICGETGSGKTTQIPQFLWECGYGDRLGSPFGREGAILVTEPRRVAAVSMAKRISEELNVPFGGDVCYHVRYDNNLSDGFKMKFATEGIILKEIQSDFLLKKYSVVIVDEAHERSVTGDILIGLLSRIVPIRNDLYIEELKKQHGIPEKTTLKPLKLVIMSATMRVADFRDNRKLFPIPPPLICVESRRFPVTNHFARKTELRAYVDEAFRKVCQIHKKLPPGGILVFLATQHEIVYLCDLLCSHYSKTRIEYYDTSYTKHHMLTAEGDIGSCNSEGDSAPSEKDEYGLKIDDYALEKDDDCTVPTTCGKRCRDDSVVHEGGGLSSEDEINGELDTLHVLPLYALMDFANQQEVFRPPPPGKRLCVVATNVAETSITIPNIRYVVDAGRVKMKTIDESTSASCFRIEWISQASAEQRSGRAGRMAPGHCYRLYSTAVFSNLMPKYSAPEILRTSLESVVLLMKHFGIEHVGTFPFPSPPKEKDLRRALTHLGLIGALSPENEYRITALGKRLVVYPIAPRFSRVIVEAINRKISATILSVVILIASIYSTTLSIFTDEGNRLKWKSSGSDGSDERMALVQSLLHPGSDLLTSLNAFGIYLTDSSTTNCNRYCLVRKSFSEAAQLGGQLRTLVAQDAVTDDVDDIGDSDVVIGGKLFDTSGLIKLPKEDEILLRKLFIVGLADQVARRATVQECRFCGVEYKNNRTTKAPYIVVGTSTIVYVHPTSSIARTFPPPEYVTFICLQKSVRSETKEPTTMMLGLTIVTREWLHEAGVMTVE
ncbi:putative ATP-dependent RNA helicase [Trypanosoma vivax]|nr:putative ATP-dependent RNA helicase [Trypanosoma vivax]